ncbi:siphovirus ReqiPepy6 Gp37-like family protein [Virgibacillus sp. C22-A2]|uniref:Siphovirus ReqiPepy6 Gp37-like family protein n=1 Tax=Virgibacillus tibetensis TaxID=3042313 RepID=A0ABU6KBD5_9BACI|nr:siphovirus ReqiPepy6 Gp37-like family protein [Virgibacillus sp. C22-A2]
MQTIKILSKEFEPLGDTTDYVSMIFTKSWHGVGSFELVIHREANGADQITKNCLVALAKNKVGIVKHREIQLDQNGKATENWLFKGWALKGLAQQRLTVPPSTNAYDSKSGDAETVMKHFIDNHLVTPANGNRAIPNLVIAPNQNRGKAISWQSRFKEVSDELTEISLASGLGWDITLDTVNKQFVFDVHEGLDLSVNQNTNSPVYFSPEFGNVKTQSFADSDLNMRNVGYVGGQGEGVEREVIVLGETTGYDRYESFIDVRDIGVTSELSERGQQKLDEMANELYFEAEIMSPVSKTTYKDEFETFVNPYQPVYERTKKIEMVGPFVYERDYNLGDITTTMNRDWGFIVDRRITEITEIHEASGFKLEAVFGQNRPTLISRLKNKFDEMEGLLKR